MTNKTNLKNTRRLNLTSIVAAGSILASATSNSAEMPHGQIETMIGDNKATLDTKVSAKLSKNISVFGRNITTKDYAQKTISPFSFVDMSYNLGNGIGAVYETQFIDVNSGTLVTPRVGIEYFKPLRKDLTFYTIGTVNIPTARDPLVNGELVANLSYTPKISKNLHGVARVETVTNFGREGLNFANQNFRLGVGKKAVETGIAINLSESPSSFTQTFGGFISYKF